MKKNLYIALAALSLMGGFITSASAAPFTNGSFEVGPDPGAVTTYDVGDVGIAGWDITVDNIDYIGTYWTSSDGGRSLDLNGNFAAGAISQSFDTLIGLGYTVEFDMAGNIVPSHLIKTLDAKINGLVVGSYIFDTTGKTFASMGWVTNSFSFTATALTTTLTFASTSGTCCWGPALDNVKVTAAPVAVPEPASLSLLAFGLVGMVGMARKKYSSMKCVV